MPDAPIPRSQHRKTRADHASELAEDYVEAIADITAAAGTCRAVDLASRFGVSHVTVNRTIARLVRDGFATTEPYAPVRLTSKGKRLAQRSKSRHETVFRFLLAIGVSDRTATIDSEGLEHHVSPETLACMDAFVRAQQT